MDDRGETGLPAQVARKLQRSSASDLLGGGFIEGVDLGGDPVAQSEDADLRLFDLELRAHLIPYSPWAVDAKARAESIRFGNEHFIYWWGQDMRRYPLERARLKADTGVHEFRVSPHACEDMLSYLTSPDNWDENGFLKMAGTQWPGYGSYPFVHAVGGHVPSAQERRTARAHGKQQVNMVLKGMPEIWALVMEVRDALGLPMPREGSLQRNGKGIVSLHILVQDKSRQALFSWHDDAEDIRVRGAAAATWSDMTTVIVNLTSECSGMRVWGCAPFLFRQPGDAVAFPGRALHESLPRYPTSPAGEVVYKVAFFFN